MNESVSELKLHFRIIGTIHSPFRERVGMPVQPVGATDVRGYIEMAPDVAEGLLDIEGFSHLILIYCLHQAKQAELVVTPFMDSQAHGIFATRSPARPNPIGLSVVRLLARVGNRLDIANVDILDGTPLLDLKPYVPEFDSYPEAPRIGWFEKARGKATTHRADDRFL